MIKHRNTPVFVIAIAWLAVSLPAAWGVYNTILNALKLFQPPVARSDIKMDPAAGK
jgi:hypothetical protein